MQLMCAGQNKCLRIMKNMEPTNEQLIHQICITPMNVSQIASQELDGVGNGHIQRRVQEQRHAERTQETERPTFTTSTPNTNTNKRNATSSKAGSASTVTTRKNSMSPAATRNSHSRTCLGTTSIFRNAVQFRCRPLLHKAYKCRDPLKVRGDKKVYQST